MRFLATLVLILSAATAAANSPAPKDATPEATREYLLDSAAADFRAHPPKALAFRKVHFGEFNEEGQTQYEICGEFQVEKEGKLVWLHFVTIRTSGYEQYIGKTPVSFCTRDGMSWDEDDWSAELQKRYEKE